MRRILMLALVVLGGVILSACDERKLTLDDVMKVQEQYESELMGLPGVVGLAAGLCPDPGGEPCLKVFVEEITSELEERIPEKLEGVRVEMEVTGPVESLPL